MNLDGVVTHGNTDIGILRDALTSAGVEAQHWRPLLASASDAMGRFVADHKQDLRVRLLPGVYDLLTYLSKRGATLGVATGNLQAIGKLKLEAAGITNFFTCGSYSDQDEYRRDVFRRALLSVHKQAGRKSKVCVLGDTPEDVRAARHNEMESIAVATGIYTIQELRAEHPSRCCSFLTDLLVDDLRSVDGKTKHRILTE